MKLSSLRTKSKILVNFCSFTDSAVAEIRRPIPLRDFKIGADHRKGGLRNPVFYFKYVILETTLPWSFIL